MANAVTTATNHMRSRGMVLLYHFIEAKEPRVRSRALIRVNSPRARDGQHAFQWQAGYRNPWPALAPPAARIISPLGDLLVIANAAALIADPSDEAYLRDGRIGAGPPIGGFRSRSIRPARRSCTTCACVSTACSDFQVQSNPHRGRPIIAFASQRRGLQSEGRT